MHCMPCQQRVLRWQTQPLGQIVVSFHELTQEVLQYIALNQQCRMYEYSTRDVLHCPTSPAEVIPELSVNAISKI